MHKIEQDSGILGIEAGGTRTSVSWRNILNGNTSHLVLGPGNFHLTSNRQWKEYFAAIQRKFPNVISIGLAVAGARNSDQHKLMAGLIHSFYPGVPCRVSHDLESAWLTPGPVPAGALRMICISGTGSCCYGVDSQGSEIRAGGWGHFLGDEGSGYHIGLSFLRSLTRAMDTGCNVPHQLVDKITNHLQLDNWNALISWLPTAGKDNIADLASICINSAQEGHEISLGVIHSAARDLAGTAHACQLKMGISSADTPSDTLEVYITGGIFKSSPEFTRKFTESFSSLCGVSHQVINLDKPTIEGALAMASRALTDEEYRTGPEEVGMTPPVAVPELDGLVQSPTEMRNPLSKNLSELSTNQAIHLFLDEDVKIPECIRLHAEAIGRVTDRIADAFKVGGRLIYAGAGTSGRLGVLDASECPPTFRSDPDMVQGIIAGGPGAMFKAVEGAEDSVSLGISSIQDINLTNKDVVVGIAASGRTPFVWGALHETRQRGAFSVLLTFNPSLVIAPDSRPDEMIAVDVGPELLTGSTRLKSGTATKLILNLFTTLAMVRIGKVVQNLMVDLHPSNDKLRKRAIRILRDLSDGRISEASCQAALEKNNWVIKDAWKSLNSI